MPCLQVGHKGGSGSGDGRTPQRSGFGPRVHAGRRNLHVRITGLFVCPPGYRSLESPNFDWTKFKEDKRIEGEKMQPKRGRIRQVPGLGRDAYFARHVLHVLTERGILTIIVFQDPADAGAGEETETKTEVAEKTLVEKAVPRM